MTYDPNGQYPPANQDPNTGGNYPASGPGYPTSGAGYPAGGTAPASGGPYPPQGGTPYQAGGTAPASGTPYQAQGGDPYQTAGYQASGYQTSGYQASSYPTSGYPGGGYQVPGTYPGGTGAVDPMTGQPLSDKTKLVAGLLSILLGSFGVGRFYMGYVGLGIMQIVVTICTGFTLGWVWPLIEGIMILSSNNIPDAQGRRLRDN